MKTQSINCASIHMLFVCFLVSFSFFVRAASAQTYFPIGAWCFDTNPPGNLDLYNRLAGNEFELIQDEENKLLNLDLTYFIACVKAEADNALINLGEELNGDFRATVEYTALNDPTIQPPYEVWRYSYQFGSVGNQSWEDGVNNGYASIGNFYGGSDGLHSALVGAELGIHQPNRWDEVEYMSQSVDNNITATPVSVVQNYYTVNISDFVANMPSNDILMIHTYPFLVEDPPEQDPASPPTPTSGPGFQAAVDRMTLHWGEAIRAIRDNEANMDFFAIVQTHESPVADWNRRLPSQAEMLVSVNMALAYGAKGIVYYLYADTGDQHGLLDANRDPTTQYDAVQEIHNDYLTTNGPLFLPLTWQAGYNVYQNTNEPIDAGYDLYDVTSRPVSGSDDAESETYVEVGVLQNSNDENHYMVVNRRCVSTGTREISVAFEAQSGHKYRVTDVFNNNITDYYPGDAAYYSHTETLGPGEGVLLRVQDLGATDLTGTLSYATVVGFGTVEVTGDVTVPSSLPLTVLPGSTLQFTSGSTDLWVEGQIIAEGTASNPITFT